MRCLAEDRAPQAAKSLEGRETWAVASARSLNRCVRLGSQPSWGLFFSRVTQRKRIMKVQATECLPYHEAPCSALSPLCFNAHNSTTASLHR